MAVAVWGFTIVIPIRSIELGLPGGFQGWLEEYSSRIGGSIWCDDRLAALTHYDPEHAAEVADSFFKRGFRSKSASAALDDELLCSVVDSQLGLQFSACNWLEFDPDFPCAWLKGSPRGHVAVPSSLRDKVPLKP
jgi:hypothetical protein